MGRITASLWRTEQGLLRLLCPLWVKVQHGAKSAPLPLFPLKRAFANAIGTSVEGQKRTLNFKGVYETGDGNNTFPFLDYS
jgi:hypothetical protein